MVIKILKNKQPLNWAIRKKTEKETAVLRVCC